MNELRQMVQVAPHTTSVLRTEVWSSYTDSHYFLQFEVLPKTSEELPKPGFVLSDVYMCLREKKIFVIGSKKQKKQKKTKKKNKEKKNVLFV